MNIICWRKKNPITYSVFMYNKTLNRKRRKKELFKSRIELGDIFKGLKKKKMVIVDDRFIMHDTIEREILKCMNRFRVNHRYDCKYYYYCYFSNRYGVKRKCHFKEFDCDNKAYRSDN